jgi:hypothetical protein
MALLLQFSDPPGCPVHGEHEPDDSFAFGAGDKVVFESARFIRRHVTEQIRLCPFWIDRAVFRSWHGLISLRNTAECRGLKKV